MTEVKHETIKSLTKRLDELQATVDSLRPSGPNDNEKIDILLAVIKKMAHFSGNNRILTEHGIEHYDLSKGDMSRWSKEG